MRAQTPFDAWPELPTDSWADTLETLHLWSQVVGKVRMCCAPWLNHSWSVALYVSTRGLRTSLVPHGAEGLELELDLLADILELRTTRGDRRTVALAPRSVSSFHAEVLEALAEVGLPVRVHPQPSEIPDSIPFHEDTAERAYEPAHARALWRALLQTERVMTRFRAEYVGKSSPVHFFWGSFDLALTRFSGRPAPPHPGGLPHFPDAVAREAYSHEVTSCGFWPGNRAAPTPIFYAYAYPTPEGFSEAAVEPESAFWLGELGEFALPYEALRTAPDADAALLSFFRTTHAVAADRAGWDREALECRPPFGPDWWHEHVDAR